MIIQGDARYRMASMEDNSVDAIITDPPYGLSFMGKKWDYNVPFVEVWEEALRVLKPGGFLLSFAGTRTYHRMAVNIEDAGFEIRDMISWLYGSGFPKSLNIGKQIDKIQGNEREVVGQTVSGKILRSNGENERPYQQGKDKIFTDQTKGNSEWEGWGTALKPACEPIVVARKPLSEKNVALNVLKWGTGGINIDGCRIPHQNQADINESTKKNRHGDFNSNDGIRVPTKGIYHGDNRPPINYDATQGRFPANIILDEEAGKMLDEQSGVSISKSYPQRQCIKPEGVTFMIDKPTGQEHNDKGGASRFFYCAKASKSERNYGCDDLEEKKAGKNQSSFDGGKILTGSGNERNNLLKNNHPTVKPIKLMEYLVKLVSREGATVLDPFSGSGTTLIACEKLGRKWIGIEKEEDYIKIIEARLKPFTEQTQLTTHKPSSKSEDLL